MGEGSGDRFKPSPDGRLYSKPEFETHLICPKNSRVFVSKPDNIFFGKEGTVFELGKNKFVRKVKLDGVEGVHVFILRELKEKI